MTWLIRRNIRESIIIGKKGSNARTAYKTNQRLCARDPPPVPASNHSFAVHDSPIQIFRAFRIELFGQPSFVECYSRKFEPGTLNGY